MFTPTLINSYELNDTIAKINRKMLDNAHVRAISFVGGPGTGKTALLETTLRQLAGRVRCGVIVGNLAAERDVLRLARLCAIAIPISTANLEAYQVREALEHMNLKDIDLLFIEAPSNALAPVEFGYGEHAKVALFSVAGGDDKAAEFPYLVSGASALLLNKTDLLPNVSFNLHSFRADVQRLNPGVNLFELSTHHPDTFRDWITWLHPAAKDHEVEPACCCLTETYLG